MYQLFVPRAVMVLARAVVLIVLALPAATPLHPLSRRLGRPLLCAPANIRVHVVEPSDLTQLAELCTSALYGDA